MRLALISFPLGVIAWVSLGTVGFVLAGLARYYEMRAGRRTRYQAIAVGAAGVLIGGLWDSWSGTSEWPPAVVLALSGILLGASTRHVFGMMLGGAD